MKKKIFSTSSRSPPRPRPRLVTAFPALPGPARSPAAAAPALHAPWSLDRPCASPRRAPLAEAISGSLVLSARTPLPATPAIALHELNAQAPAATPPNTAFALPSWTPPNMVRCPRKRVNSTFRPPAAMLPLRAFTRQRKMLIEYAADHIRHMQKALDLMNVKLHLIVSDITGVTGLRIIRAIVDGQHDPAKLTEMREPGCRATEQEFVQALSGNYRPEHLFALEQAVALFETYQSKIAECDSQIVATLASFEHSGEKKAPRARRENGGRTSCTSMAVRFCTNWSESISRSFPVCRLRACSQWCQKQVRTCRPGAMVITSRPGWR